MEWLCYFTGLLGFLACVIILYLEFLKRRHYWSDKNIPCEPCFMGMSLLNIFHRKMYWLCDAELYKKHGRVFGSYELFRPNIFVADPKILRRIFVKDFHIFPERRPVNTNDELIDSTVNFMKGQQWKRLRSLITPSFNTGKLRKMMPLMSESARNAVDYIQFLTQKSEIMDCKRVLSGYTMDLIANTIFATKVNSAWNPEHLFVRNALEINANFIWRSATIGLFPRLTKLLGFRVVKPTLVQFFKDLIDEIVTKRAKSGEVREDFLQSLLEIKAQSTAEEEGDRESNTEDSQESLHLHAKSKTLTSNELYAQCILFLVAGTDTITNVMALTLYCLALNPDCLTKVIQEVDQIWKEHSTLESDALNKLTFLDAVISESLRLFPSIPRLERGAVQDYSLPEYGLTIPKGMRVEIPVYSIHRDPEFFPNPEAFNPERFLPENAKNILPFTFLPFGHGPRSCIAMRLSFTVFKVCFSHLFRSFTVEPCAMTKVPPQINVRSGLLSVKEVTLKIIPRKRIA